MSDNRALSVRRLLAFTVDWLVILLWAGLLFSAVMLATEGLPYWVWLPAAIALVVPLWWLFSMFATGRTPYDRLSGSRVSRSAKT